MWFYHHENYEKYYSITIIICKMRTSGLFYTSSGSLVFNIIRYLEKIIYYILRVIRIHEYFINKCTVKYIPQDKV